MEEQKTRIYQVEHKMHPSAPGKGILPKLTIKAYRSNTHTSQSEKHHTHERDLPSNPPFPPWVSALEEVSTGPYFIVQNSQIIGQI